jgi:hypothetical protein
VFVFFGCYMFREFVLFVRFVLGFFCVCFAYPYVAFLLSFFRSVYVFFILRSS